MSIKIAGPDTSTNRAFKCADVVVCLQIPNHILFSWHSNATANTDYIDLVNKSIEHGAIKICSSATRFHKRICDKASYISREHKRKNWRKRNEYLLKYTYFDVKSNEIVNVEKLETRMNNSVENYR